MIKLFNGDNVDLTSDIESGSVDMVLTSPPYGSIKNYKGTLFWDFESIAIELIRVLKSGGVIIWVVGDQTKLGSESGESFRQALFFFK